MIYDIKFILSFKNIYKEKNQELVEFVNYYNKIIKEDNIKPIFSKTDKCKSFSNNIGKNENSWTPHLYSSPLEQIKHEIISILNKITKNNFGFLSKELICILQKHKYVEILDILVVNILNKTYNDNEFINLYVDLCANIWGLYDWHEKLTSIIKNGSKFCWIKNYYTVQDKIVYSQHFDTIKECKEDIHKNVNLKLNLINILQDNFINRAKQNKKNVYSELQFLTELYNKKYISNKIIHVIMLKLINYPKYTEVNDIDLEGFCIVLNNVSINSLKNNYIKYVHKILDNNHFCNRTRFMLENLSNYKTVKDNKSESDYDESDYDTADSLIEEYLETNDINKFISNININKKVLIECIFNTAIEHIKYHNNLSKLIKRLNYKIDYNDIISSLDIEDIKLDIADADKRLDKFVSILNSS